MNYLCLGGRFNIKYMYVDLNVDVNYVADSLFCKRNIPVKFKDEMVREGDNYRLIFVKIPRKYKEKFEEALKEIPHKMELLGHLDYMDYCNELMNKMEIGKDAISNKHFRQRAAQLD